MLRDRVLPQSEVIRAILLEYSPCCGPHLLEHPARELELRNGRLAPELLHWLGAQLPAAFH